MRTKIALLNYGSGNICSLSQSLKTISVDFEIINSPNQFHDLSCTHLLLPGVGAFDSCSHLLASSGFDELIVTLQQKGLHPILGICVGMQMLLDSSDEGSSKGLSIIPGRCRSLACSGSQISPHIGWNNLSISNSSHANFSIFDKISSHHYFYFVHNYYCDICNSTDILSVSSCSTVSFASAICNSLTFGVQFHPEKSHNSGLQLFLNFANLTC